MKDIKMNVVIGFVVLIGVFTVLLGWLKLLDLAFVNDKTMLVAAIGLIGAIVGGVISGALTLIGVKLTIGNMQKSEFKKLLPKQVTTLYMLLKQFRKIRYQITKAFEEINETGYDSGFHDIEIMGLLHEIDEELDEIFLQCNKVSVDDEALLLHFASAVRDLLDFHYNLVELEEDPEDWDYFAYYSDAYIDDIELKLLDTLKQTEDEYIITYRKLKAQLY